MDMKQEKKGLISSSPLLMKSIHHYLRNCCIFLRAETWNLKGKNPNQKLYSQRTEMSKILCQICLSSDARTLPQSQDIMLALRRLAVSSHSSSPPTLLHSYWVISVSLCIIHSVNTTTSWFPYHHPYYHPSPLHFINVLS